MKNNNQAKDCRVVPLMRISWIWVSEYRHRDRSIRLDEERRRERRERERRERERVDVKRERLDRERRERQREKDQQERLERERKKEMTPDKVVSSCDISEVLQPETEHVENAVDTPRPANAALFGQEDSSSGSDSSEGSGSSGSESDWWWLSDIPRGVAFPRGIAFPRGFNS